MSLAVGLSGLIPGTNELIAELVERLSTGETFDNRKLTAVADRFSAAAAARECTAHATRTMRWRRRLTGCCSETERNP